MEELIYFCPIQANINLDVAARDVSPALGLGITTLSGEQFIIRNEQPKSSNSHKTLVFVTFHSFFSCVAVYSHTNCVNYGEHTVNIKMFKCLRLHTCAATREDRTSGSKWHWPGHRANSRNANARQANTHACTQARGHSGDLSDGLQSCCVRVNSSLSISIPVFGFLWWVSYCFHYSS